jgi:hypothetical protein
MDDHDIALAIAESMFDSAKKHHETALKFQKQLESIIASMDDDGKTALLHDRMQKAVAHFTKAIYDDLITPLENHLQKISRQKKLRQYVALLFGLQNIVWAKLEQVFHASYNNQTFNQQLTPFKRKNIEYKPPAKVPPGTTRLETLKRFTDGQSIDEIALSRNLAISTIEGHLADCIAHGDIELQEVLDQKLIDIILPEVEKQPGATSAEIKLVLGEAISYAQIRMVMMHLKNLKADAAGGSNISA